jgi:hypothetical protein
MTLNMNWKTKRVKALILYVQNWHLRVKQWHIKQIKLLVFWTKCDNLYVHFTETQLSASDRVNQKLINWQCQNMPAFHCLVQTSLPWSCRVTDVSSPYSHMLFLKKHFNTILPFTRNSPKRFLPIRPVTIVLPSLFKFSMYDTWRLTYLTIINLIPVGLFEDSLVQINLERSMQTEVTFTRDRHKMPTVTNLILTINKRRHSGV